MGSLKQTETDFDDIGAKVLSPSTLAHVVLRTGKFRQMVDFYLNFLGGTITYGNDFIAFITYDEEHHRIALIGMPDTGPKVPTSAGFGTHCLYLSYIVGSPSGISTTQSPRHPTCLVRQPWTHYVHLL